MNAHEVWRKGWLKNKPYCYNTQHNFYNPHIDKIIRDNQKGQNRVVVVVGTPRSGKSWFSIWLMCYLTYNFFGKESTVDDIYWDLDKFIGATKEPENQKKWLVMEEQGIAQYKTQWFQKDVVAYDKLIQIFGIDETNILVNLPYLHDLQKGQRNKAQYLIRCMRKTKKRFNTVLCEKKMNLTTEKAYFKAIDTWENIPSVYDVKNEELRDKFIKILMEYEKKKIDFNSKQKDELLKSATHTGKKADSGFLKAKPMFTLK